MHLIDHYAYLHRCNLRRQEEEALQQLNDKLRCHELALTIMPRLAETLPFNLDYTNKTTRATPKNAKHLLPPVLRNKDLARQAQSPL